MTSDQELLDFIVDLDESDLDVTMWETLFIDSILTNGQVDFTPKQREVITKMMERYEDRLS